MPVLRNTTSALMISSLLIASCAIPSGTLAGESWNTFQNGGAPSFAQLDEVSLGEIRWSCDLQGYGQSSPIVWENQIYITTIEGDNKEKCHITAFDLTTGDQLWQHTVTNASPRENNTYVSRAAPTPAADGRGVVCFFEGGNVVSLTHGGQVRWERNLVAEFGPLDARHGLSASLEQNDDSVFVWIERSEAPYVLSLAKESGELQWKSPGIGATSWASPRLIPVDGGHHLVLSAIGTLAGLDPTDGSLLWNFADISGNSTPTPVPVGTGEFLIGATTGRGESAGGRAADSNGVIRIEQTENGTWDASYVWQAKRATSSFGSPIVHNDIAFFVNREGVLYGLNAESGEELFAKRLKGSSWATPIGVGHQVFFFGRDGKVDRVSDLTGSQKITTWNKLPEPPLPEEPSDSNGDEQPGRRGPAMSSGPVVYAATWCRDQVLLRRGDKLFAVQIKSETSTTTATTNAPAAR